MQTENSADLVTRRRDFYFQTTGNAKMYPDFDMQKEEIVAWAVQEIASELAVS